MSESLQILKNYEILVMSKNWYVFVSRLILIGTFCLFLFSKLDLFVANIQFLFLNRSHLAKISFPWASPQWSAPLCPVSKTTSSLSPPLSCQENMCFLGVAIIESANGRCAEAIDALILAAPTRASERIQLAYLLAAEQDWYLSTTFLPQLVVNEESELNAFWPYDLKEYWMNVFYRASNQSLQNSQLLYQNAEKMARFSMINGNQELIKTYLAQNKMDEAIFEAQVALMGASLTEFDRYFSLFEHSLISDYQADWISIASDETNVAAIDKISWNLSPYVKVLQENDSVTSEAWMVNLAPNPHFNLGPDVDNVRPVGYMGIYGDVLNYPYSIEVKGDNDRYFCLNNDTKSSSGVLSIPTPLDSSANKFLLGGSIQTTNDAKATLGITWRDQSGKLNYEYIANGISSQSWISFMDIVKLENPKDVSIHLIQFESNGKACFDKLFLFVLN